MKRFILALCLLLSCSAPVIAQTNVHIFQSGPSAIAEQFVVLRDKTLPVLGELQQKYQRGSKPEIAILDNRSTHRTTKAYVGMKPRDTAYPYFFLVAKGGLILAQGELAATTEANVEFVAKFQAKEKAADVPPRAVMLQMATGQIVGGIVYVGGTQYVVTDVTIIKLPATIPDTIPSKVDRVTFVFEKDNSSVPRPVAFALQRINADSAGLIVASDFEEDIVDGAGEVPDQYKVALEAASKVGLPALVVESNGKVLRVVKNPLTAEQVLEAAR